MYDRITKLIGETNIKKINNTTVAVIGLGGVGGSALECLVRSGIENIIIVDFDKIDITNLNRQIISNINNIGNSKVEEWIKRINIINPNTKVTPLNLKLDMNNIEELFNLKFDYLIDAIDDIPMKEEIIKRCLTNNIEIISSMGTGNKLNPSMLEITDIKNTSYDPIAKKIRKYMKDNNLKRKLPVVYSKEQNNKFEGSIPSMIFVPSTAGILCANYVIRKIIEKSL